MWAGCCCHAWDRRWSHFCQGQAQPQFHLCRCNLDCYSTHPAISYVCLCFHMNGQVVRTQKFVTWTHALVDTENVLMHLRDEWNFGKWNLRSLTCIKTSFHVKSFLVTKPMALATENKSASDALASLNRWVFVWMNIVKYFHRATLQILVGDQLFENI